jgi:spore maturation protein CgeB
VKRLQIVMLGLSITSSWGNGHATTYRALVKALAARGHEILFLERDVPWYAAHRDELTPEGCRVELYQDLPELYGRLERSVREADVVIVGSYVPDGVEVLQWVLSTARGLRVFYDIDTPVTLARLESGEPTYLTRESIPELDAYLSFSGGEALRRLEREYQARVALPLYCSVDPELYSPEEVTPERDLGYLGTYCADRHPTLERLLLEPARRHPGGRFIVAGACYPEQAWPGNVERYEHVPPGEHAKFYSSQRFTLNVTRAHMIEIGHSPSVRLFEAAACGVPIIGDRWTGIEEFFEPGREILIADAADEVLDYLTRMTEVERRTLAWRARQRVLREHTASRRAQELEGYFRRLGVLAPARRALHRPRARVTRQKMVGS